MKRTVWIAVGLGTVVAVAGATWAAASQVMRSPAQLAADADPPELSEVTAPVELRELVADVTVRSTVQFDDPVTVSLNGSVDVDGELIVTRAPAVDDEIGDGGVVVEVSGRPVFVLAGEVPPYRDLRPGTSGEDVEQLQVALDRLGYDLGPIDGVFGPNTQAAVESLYTDAGFDPPAPSREELDRLQQAEERAAAADGQLLQARQVRDQAAAGPRRSERLQAQAAVNEAKDAFDALPAEASATDRRRAQEQLLIAIANRDELLAEPDTSAEDRALTAAREERDNAQEHLDRLRSQSGTWLPAGEIVVLEQLPQRIDRVEAEQGEPANGDLVTLSGSDVVLEVEIPAADIELVAPGDQVFLRPDGGGELEGEIVELSDQPGTDGAADETHAARIVPNESGADLIGMSVRVRIPVSSTEGEVLVVPIVAVYAAADGSSQVEVINDETSGSSRVVRVQPGLAADGMVEVVPLDGELAEGDQVVVGS